MARKAIDVAEVAGGFSAIRNRAVADWVLMAALTIYLRSGTQYGACQAIGMVLVPGLVRCDLAELSAFECQNTSIR